MAVTAEKERRGNKRRLVEECLVVEIVKANGEANSGRILALIIF